MTQEEPTQQEQAKKEPETVAYSTIFQAAQLIGVPAKDLIDIMKQIGFVHLIDRAGMIRKVPS